MAAPEKRFFVNEIKHAFESIGNAFTSAWNGAKDTFNNLTHGLNINFDDVVNQLIPLIDSGMTEAGCITTCTGASASILGPAAPIAATVCAPLCKAALAKLEEAAGR